VSQRTHQRQLDRARAKREAEAAAAKSQRGRLFVSIAVAVVAVLAIVLAFTIGGGDDEPNLASDDQTTDGFDTGDDAGTTPDDPATQPDTTPVDRVDVAVTEPVAADRTPCEAPSEGAPEITATPYAAAPEMAIDPGLTYHATIQTTCGTIEVDLFAEAAPLAVNNFVSLARDGYYDGVPFHRVIDGFMVQGGDPTGTGHGGNGEYPGYTFGDELDTVAKYGYPRGVLALANAGPATNGSQFFIVQGDASHLTSHTVFGVVTAGMAVVDRIVLGPEQGGIAIEPVRMISVVITEA